MRHTAQLSLTALKSKHNCVSTRNPSKITHNAFTASPVPCTNNNNMLVSPDPQSDELTTNLPDGEYVSDHDPMDEEMAQWRAAFFGSDVGVGECTVEHNNVSDISPFDDAHFNEQNGYLILEKAADTIQGELYKARLCKPSPNAPTGSLVAIKRTHKTLFEQKMVFEDEDGLNEFVEEDVMKEAMLLNHLTVNHQAAGDHIAKFIDFYESDSHYYLVTAWVDGLNLADFTTKAHALIEEGKMCQKDWLKTVKFIMWQLTATMRWLHDVYACCHLDLCLENIMVENAVFEQQRDGSYKASQRLNLKLCDFGVAELFDKKVFRCIKGGLTVDNEPYVAPKVFDNDIYDARKADAWAMGIILFRLMTNTAPYLAEDIWDDPQNGYAAIKEGKLCKFLKMNHVKMSSAASKLLCSLLSFDEDARPFAKSVIRAKWFKAYYERYGAQIERNMRSDAKLLKQQSEQMASFPYYAQI